MTIKVIKMKIKGDYNCASVSGEINHDEGYCWLYIWLNFINSLPYGFGTFMQDYLEKHGVKSKAIESYYEVGIPQTFPEDEFHHKKLLIEFTAADTEYAHFEEYFEGSDFLEFMKKAIDEFKYGSEEEVPQDQTTLRILKEQLERGD